MRLIDADELKNREIVIDYDEVDDTFDDGLLFVTDLIDKSPTVDAVPVRHGRWIWDENGMDWGLGAWKCSECHRKPETWWEADKGNPYRCAGSRYCNNCGAKMDGGADSGGA